jgi:hypothetical protein
MKGKCGVQVEEEGCPKLWSGTGLAWLDARPAWRKPMLALPLLRPRWTFPFKRQYATVKSPLLLGKPPNLPPQTPSPRPLDRFILESLARTKGCTALPQLVQQYLDRSGIVLDAQLPYEPHPSPSRRVSFSASSGGDVHLIAHVARENDRNKVTVSSGFALETSSGQPILVTCAHTLEEVCCPSGALCMCTCR